MLDCYTKHQMLGQAPFLPNKSCCQPTATLLSEGEDNKETKSIPGALEPPAAFACFRLTTADKPLAQFHDRPLLLSPAKPLLLGEDQTPSISFARNLH